MPKEVFSYVHAHGMESKGKILMVASSPSTSKQTGWPIGFWASEVGWKRFYMFVAIV